MPLAPLETLLVSFTFWLITQPLWYRKLTTSRSEYDESYVTLYKRATALLSLGRNSAALEDFDHILRINPAFSKVRRLLRD